MAIKGGDSETDRTDGVNYRIISESLKGQNPRLVLRDATASLFQQPGVLFDNKACWRVCELKESDNGAENRSKIGILDTNAWIVGEYLSRRDAATDAARELLRLLKRVQQSLTACLHLLGKDGGKFCDTHRGSVWVPPSSSGVSSSKHGAVPNGVGQKAARDITAAFKKRFGSEWRFEECIACVSELKKCRKHLVLGIAFWILRGNARTVREREECIEAMEVAAEACRSNLCFQAWMSITKLQKSIQGYVNSMNKQVDSNLLRETLIGWRSRASTRAMLRSRQEVAQKGYERMILSASMRHWKIFMCSNALEDVQRDICHGWWRDISLYKLFSAWKNLARRHAVLKDRLYFYSQELAMPQSDKNTVDMMLGENSFGNFVAGLRSKYDDAKHSMQKLLVLRIEPNVLRWKHVDFAELPKMYSPEKYEDKSQYDDESMDVCVSLLRCQERDIALQANLTCLEQDVNEKREMFYLIKRKYEYLSNKVSEYSETVEEIENIRVRFEQQLDIGREEAATRDHELSDANDMLTNLQSLLTSVSHSVNKANENAEKHTKDIEKARADIAMWKTRVQSCNARALQNERDTAAVLKLKESKEQLRRAEIQFHNLNQMEESLRFTKRDAARAEAELKFEIERIKAKHESIHSDMKRVTSDIDRIQEHLILLENQKNHLLPKLEHFSRNLEASNESVKTIINQISATEQRLSETRAKIEMNQRLHSQITIKKKKEVNKVKQQSTKTVISYPHKLTAVNPTIAPSDQHRDKTNQIFAASRETCGAEFDDDEDNLDTLSSASFLVRLVHRHFAHWKLEADDAKMKSNLAQERHTASCLSTAVSAWITSTRFQKDGDMDRVDYFRLTRAFQSWIRYKRQRQAQNATICKHLDIKTRTNLAQMLTHWKLFAAKAAAAYDLRCRLDNILKCKIFQHWRIRTVVNNNLSLRLVEFEQIKSQRALQHYFAEWKRARYCRALLRRVVTFACQRWKEYIQDMMYHSPENTLSRTLTAWQMAVHSSREERRLDRIHASIQCAHEENLETQCLSIWRQHATSSRAIRIAREENLGQKILQFSEKLALKTKAASLSTWLTYTLEKTAAVAALAVECTVDQPRHSALTAWRLAVQDSIYRKRRAHAAKNMLSTSTPTVPTKHMSSSRSTLIAINSPLTSTSTRQPLANVTNTPPIFFSSAVPIPNN
eukprot:jgi/Picsp_1/2035/NSC_05500-R1_---NA---